MRPTWRRENTPGTTAGRSFVKRPTTVTSRASTSMTTTYSSSPKGTRRAIPPATNTTHVATAPRRSMPQATRRAGSTSSIYQRERSHRKATSPAMSTIQEERCSICALPLACAISSLTTASASSLPSLVASPRVRSPPMTMMRARTLSARPTPASPQRRSPTTRWDGRSRAPMPSDTRRASDTTRWAVPYGSSEPTGPTSSSPTTASAT